MSIAVTASYYLEKMEFSEAAILLEKYREEYPEDLDSLRVLGRAYLGLRNYQNALEVFTELHKRDKDNIDALHSVARCLYWLGNYKKSYAYASHAIKNAGPNEAYLLTRGLAAQKGGLTEEAESDFRALLEISPNHPDALHNLATLIAAKNQLVEAICLFERAYRVSPSNKAALGSAIYYARMTSAWIIERKYSAELKSLGIEGGIISPFGILALDDDPQRNLLRSRNYWSVMTAGISRKLSEHESTEKLRIGYFSSDFYDHATMHLFADVIKCHDRDQFEVFGYIIRNQKNDQVAQASLSLFDVVRDVTRFNDEKIAKLARDDRIDIAVDLKGFTSFSRPAIFAHGAGKIQINYLGYPGSMGSKTMDYIIADETLISADDEKYYDEQVLRLPKCYQPNRQLYSPSKPVSRDMYGLPQNVPVLTSFNAIYKVGLEEFLIWMQILQKHRSAVLWIICANDDAYLNLLHLGKQQGVEGERIIRAHPVSHEEHVARIGLADLFLDSFKVCAHTTASDALRAGLPIVTKFGAGFASRVAASLLKSCGLEEWITYSEEEYFEKIDQYLSAGDLETQKTKVRDAVAKSDLFNPHVYTKELEKLYLDVMSPHMKRVDRCKKQEHQAEKIALERDSWSALDRNLISSSRIDLAEMRDSCSEHSFMQHEKSLRDSAASINPKDIAACRFGFQVHVDRSSPFSRIFDPLAFQFLQLFSKHDIPAGRQNQPRLIFGAHQNVSYWLKELRDSDVLINLEHLDDPEFKKKNMEYIELLRRCSRVLTLWQSDLLDRESQILFEPPLLTPSEIINAKFQVNSQGLFLGSLNDRRALRLRDIASRLKLPLDLAFNLHGFDMWTKVATSSHLLSVDFYKSAAFNKYRLALFVGLPSTCSIFITNGQPIPPEYQMLKGISVFDDESSIDFDVTDPKWTKEVLALQKETGALMNESFFKGDFLGQLVF